MRLQDDLKVREKSSSSNSNTVQHSIRAFSGENAKTEKDFVNAVLAYLPKKESEDRGLQEILQKCEKTISMLEEKKKLSNLDAKDTDAYNQAVSLKAEVTVQILDIHSKYADDEKVPDDVVVTDEDQKERVWKIRMAKHCTLANLIFPVNLNSFSSMP